MLQSFVETEAGAVAVVLLIAIIRTVRWCYFAARNSDLVWSVGSAGRVLIPAATDTLWITALHDPERLAKTAEHFAETWARRRAVKALLGRVQVTAHWLWAGMPHSHALSVVNHTHAEAAFALHETLRGISSVGADLKDHLAAWMSHVPGHHAATGPDFIVHYVAPDGPVYAPDPTDAAGAIGFLVAWSLLQQGRKVCKGDKTMLEAAADGSTEVAVKYAGGFLVVTIVHFVVHHFVPIVGTFCVVVGRWGAGTGLKKWRQRTLRSLKRTLQDRVAEVGAELYAPGRHDKLQDLIWVPWRQNRAAVAALSPEAWRSRHDFAYWIWPSPHQVARPS
jgi:hypothetical protein